MEVTLNRRGSMNDVQMNWENWNHVYPLNDLIEHNTSLVTEQAETYLCQCRPKLDIDNQIIIHDAMDGRPE